VKNSDFNVFVGWITSGWLNSSVIECGFFVSVDFLGLPLKCFSFFICLLGWDSFWDCFRFLLLLLPVKCSWECLDDL